MSATNMANRLKMTMRLQVVIMIITGVSSNFAEEMSCRNSQLGDFDFNEILNILGNHYDENRS